MPLTEKQLIQVNQAVFSLANAYRSRMVKEGMEERTGLSLSDRSTLMVLGQFEPTTAGALSRQMDINPGTVSVYVQRLVERDLVVRSQDEKDRRTWVLSLTREGRKAYEETLAGTVEYTRDFLAMLTHAEQEALHGIMLRVAGGLGHAW